MKSPKLLTAEQKRAVSDILTDKVFCITDDCGQGKTIIGLTAMVLLKKKLKNQKMLVVCTPEGIKNAWTNEHKGWEHTRHLNVVPLVGTPAARKAKLLGTDADVYGVTYHNLEWLVKTNTKHRFTFVYADEADCLKGPTSKWRKYLIQAAPNAPRRILATATPKAKEEDDYFGLCMYLDRGRSLGVKNVTEFRAQYCVSYAIKGRVMYRIDKKKVPALEQNIEHLFRRYSEASEIPVKVVTLYSRLSPASQETYDTLLKEQCTNSLVLKIDGAVDESKSLDAMALTNKLNQLTSGFLYYDEFVRIDAKTLRDAENLAVFSKTLKKRKTLYLFNDRVIALRKALAMIKQKHNCPVIITYTFKAELAHLKRVLPMAVPDTEPHIEARWNANQIQYLLLQYTRSSKSLNLQKGAGHVMVMFSPTFRWVDDYQIIRRLARTGQKAKTVYLYRLYLRGTIDDSKTKKLTDRFAGHRRFQKRIFARLQNT